MKNFSIELYQNAKCNYFKGTLFAVDMFDSFTVRNRTTKTSLNFTVEPFHIPPFNGFCLPWGNFPASQQIRQGIDYACRQRSEFQHST